MLALPLIVAVAFLGSPRESTAKADAFTPDPAWKSFGKDLWFDAKTRRLILRAQVALVDGALEHLICSKGTKDHESTLTTEAPPRLIHAVLLLTGAEQGRPVRFEPKFAPPTGTPIAIELEWIGLDGKTRRADARTWVKDLKTKKPLTTDWVFAGSEIFVDPKTKAKLYAADDGDLVTVANFPSAILDLPFRSSADDGDRTYVSNTEAMPPRGTPVTVYLQPRRSSDGKSAQAKPKP